MIWFRKQSYGLKAPLFAALRFQSAPVARQTIVVFGADNSAKKNMPAIRRNRVAEKRRLINRARKSAVATRVKKVMTAITSLQTSDKLTQIDIKPVEKLVSEAYSEIDKALIKGVMHRNTGARRKSRVAGAKRRLSIK